jgi:hypothetical protein
MMRRWAIVTLMILISGCAPAASPTANPAQISTPGPLTKTADYWDLGLRIPYPDNWVTPQFLNGQMTLGGSVNAMRGSAAEPVIAIRIVDPVKDFRLSKNATLQQIAAAMSAGQGVTISKTGPTSVAGLDAAFIDLTENRASMYGQAIAFRMPDGRVGSIIGVAPFEMWADFAPTFDKMRQTATLIKPTDFSVPQSGSTQANFPTGGLSFTLPQGWISKNLGGNAYLYRQNGMDEYLDDSGFVNGPQLVLLARRLASGVNLRTAMTSLVNVGDKVSDTTVGGQPALLVTSADQTSGQVILFIGVPSQDKTVLNVFRWTAPSLVAQAVRPTLDAILQSVKFGAVTTTLAAPATP